MIIYLCIKYKSNTLIFLKDIEQKPFFVCMDRGTERTDRTYWRMYGQQWCYKPSQPPIENGGIMKTIFSAEKTVLVAAYFCLLYEHR